jgi:hypothetical protein
MLTRTAFLLCLAALAAPASAAADDLVAADPAAGSVTALNGRVVWVSGPYGAERLMRTTATGFERVPGAPTAKSYSSIDLGLDPRGHTVLTYLRCRRAGRCTAIRDDLRGHRASIRGLAPRGCALSTAPSMWRARVAYGLGCRHGGSGLYVKRGSSVRRLPLPHDAVKFGSTAIAWVDLRGTRVGAATEDIYSYAFVDTVNGTRKGSWLAAASEGESDEHVVGLSVGSLGDLWALTDSVHTGDPNEAVIGHMIGTCFDYEALPNASASDDGYRAVGLAVDGPALYLAAPGTGIVRHAFTPSRRCG